MSKLELFHYMNILKENKGFFSEGDYNAAYVAVMYLKNNPEGSEAVAKKSQLESLLDGYFEQVIE